MRKRDQKTEGYRIKKDIFESLPKPDTSDMVQIFYLLNHERVLNKTFIPRSQAKDWQLKKEL